MTEIRSDIIRVRCLLCNQILECQRDDTTALVAHIREDHSEVTLKESSEFEKVSQDSIIKIFSKNDSNQTIHFKKDSKSASTVTVVAPAKKTGRKLENEHTTKHIPKSNKPDQTVNEKKSITPKDPTSSHLTKKELNHSEVLYKRKYKYKKPISYRRAGKRKLYRTSIEKWRPGRSTVVCPECGANKRPIIKNRTDKVAHSPLGAAFILTCWPLCFLPWLYQPTEKEFLHCVVCNHFLGVYDRKTEVINPNQMSINRLKNDDK